MKKHLILTIFSLVFSTSIFAHNHTEHTADIVLNDILTGAMSSLEVAKKNNKDIKMTEVKDLIYKDLIPFIDTKFVASQTLKKHWKNLNNKQKLNLENYIINSLITDYSGILTQFNDFSKIKITVNPKIRTKGNKAIVKIDFNTTEGNNSIMIAAKMIKNDSWKIYDIVFSGVSLLKNYAAQFNSYIKRKGFEKFSAKYLDK